MTDQDLIDHHDAAYDMARGCRTYAPRQGTDEGEALYNATKSGGTSAARSDDWMRLYTEMQQRGLVSVRHPHLFPANKLIPFYVDDGLGARITATAQEFIRQATK